MKTQPLVSIVVPCMNRAHFLKPTIDSILEQDYPNLECIVVDGASTDGTLDILKDYGDVIRWVSEPDDGHADAINKGWKMSRGDILAWLNADDMYAAPDAISKAVTYFKGNPDVDVVYGDYVHISEDGGIISKVLSPRRWNLTYAVKYCYFTIVQPAAFMKRSILEQVNWLDPEFRNGKDHELWLRIGLIGTIKYTPDLFASVRDVPGLSQRPDIGEAKVAITRKFFNLPNLPLPFLNKGFQRRALSNSYLVASTYAVFGWRDLISHRALSVSIGYVYFKATLFYLLKAIATDPLNFPYIMTRCFANFLHFILPYRFQRMILNSKIRHYSINDFFSRIFSHRKGSAVNP